MNMKTRTTEDEFQLISNYGYGWECELTEETYKEIKIRLKEYRENSNGMHRIKKVRLPIKVDSRKYEIFYNDGAFYGSVEFRNTTEGKIKKAILQEIKNNNKNPNRDYHISFKNFKEV